MVLWTTDLRGSVADSTDRYALLVDAGSHDPTAHPHVVRYDLVNGVAVDIADVPTNLVQNPTLGPCSGVSLLDSGDVILANDSFKTSCSYVPTIGTGKAVALWHDGVWSRDPSMLAGAAGVRPSFAGADGDDSAVRVLQGVEAVGQVHWTDAQFAPSGADDTGWYLDGDIAVGQVCANRVNEACDEQLVGLDPTTGDVRWTLPGTRLVAGDSADGRVLVGPRSSATYSNQPAGSCSTTAPVARFPARRTPHRPAPVTQHGPPAVADHQLKPPRHHCLSPRRTWRVFGAPMRWTMRWAHWCS
jgi:hypothetical protein